jgi:hypothetical protein
MQNHLPRTVRDIGKVVFECIAVESCLVSGCFEDVLSQNEMAFDFWAYLKRNGKFHHERAILEEAIYE